jgi:hypothetical protein
MSGTCLEETTPVDSGVDLIRFVRVTLGCGCPDEVLARIAVDVSGVGECGLDVGGRLLVRVLDVDDVDRLIETFPDTVERLRGERDRRGFRRLRLVVTHPEPEVLRETLEDILGLIGAADERVYIHVLENEDLPSMLTLGS